VTKMCDYFVSEARKNPEQTHIINLTRHLVNDDNTSQTGEVVSRQTVVQDIEHGLTYMVAYRVNGAWRIGSKVEIYPYNGTKYLRTDRDNTPADNLDNLSITNQ
jgi:hypothetical protein